MIRLSEIQNERPRNTYDINKKGLDNAKIVINERIRQSKLKPPKSNVHETYRKLVNNQPNYQMPEREYTTTLYSNEPISTSADEYEFLIRNANYIDMVTR